MSGCDRGANPNSRGRNYYQRRFVCRSNEPVHPIPTYVLPPRSPELYKKIAMTVCPPGVWSSDEEARPDVKGNSYPPTSSSLFRGQGRDQRALPAFRRRPDLLEPLLSDYESSSPDPRRRWKPRRGGDDNVSSLSSDDERVRCDILVPTTSNAHKPAQVDGRSVEKTLSSSTSLSEVKEEVKVEVKEEVKAEVKVEVKAKVKEEVKAEVKVEVKEEVKDIIARMMEKPEEELICANAFMTPIPSSEDHTLEEIVWEQLQINHNLTQTPYRCQRVIMNSSIVPCDTPDEAWSSSRALMAVPASRNKEHSGPNMTPTPLARFVRYSEDGIWTGTNATTRRLEQLIRFPDYGCGSDDYSSTEELASFTEARTNGKSLEIHASPTRPAATTAQRKSQGKEATTSGTASAQLATDRRAGVEWAFGISAGTEGSDGGADSHLALVPGTRCAMYSGSAEFKRLSLQVMPAVAMKIGTKCPVTKADPQGPQTEIPSTSNAAEAALAQGFRQEWPSTSVAAEAGLAQGFRQGWPSTSMAAAAALVQGPRQGWPSTSAEPWTSKAAAAAMAQESRQRAPSTSKAATAPLAQESRKGGPSIIKAATATAEMPLRFRRQWPPVDMHWNAPPNAPQSFKNVPASSSKNPRSLGPRAGCGDGPWQNNSSSNGGQMEFCWEAGDERADICAMVLRSDKEIMRNWNVLLPRRADRKKWRSWDPPQPVEIPEEVWESVSARLTREAEERWQKMQKEKSATARSTTTRKPDETVMQPNGIAQKFSERWGPEAWAAIRDNEIQDEPTSSSACTESGTQIQHTSQPQDLQSI